MQLFCIKQLNVFYSFDQIFYMAEPVYLTLYILLSLCYRKARQLSQDIDVEDIESKGVFIYVCT